MSPIWILLELRMTEVPVTTAAKRDVQSSGQFITISKPHPAFYRPDVLPVTQPTASER